MTPLFLVLVGALTSAVGAFWYQSRQTANARAQAEKFEHLLNLVTGGESYAFLYPVSSSDDSVQVAMMPRDDYGLHNLTIRVRRGPSTIPDCTELTPEVIKQLVSSDYTYSATFVNPHLGQVLEYMLKLEGDSTSYSVNFSARNGQWRRAIHLKRSPTGGVKWASTATWEGADGTRELSIPGAAGD